MIVMDDWGFNDVSWHDHTNTNMPFLDEFVKESALIIDTFYAYPLCSISRTALLTGRFPIRYGLQSSVIENVYPFGLSIFETTLAQDLKQNGYNTAMIGKWHLGFHRNDMTPLQRGFDEFRGSLSPMIHFYEYEYQVIGQENGFAGKDLYINDQQISAEDTDGQYLTYWERDQFIDILDTLHKDSNPFFLYVAMHASHSPHDAPSECLGFYDAEQCVANKWDPGGYYQCAEHQIVQGQTSCADEALEDMIMALRDMDNGNVWNNTLLIWLSDNGAPVWDSDNAPLRGAKKFLYEGGVRTPSFVSGGYLNKERYGKIYGEGSVPFHITDWYPTILSLANIDVDVGERILDGKDQWNAIQYGIISQELSTQNREFLYNAESKGCQNEICGAYRYGEYKLIWISDDAIDSQPFWYDFYAKQSRFNADGSRNEEYADYLNCGPIPDNVQYTKEYDENGALIGSLPCNDHPCLFNVVMDPCEYNDLSQMKEYENLYAFMYTMLKIWYDEAQQVPLAEYYEDEIDERSDPVNFNGFWQPWIRDYDERDSFVDFEDVMKVYAKEHDLKMDVRQSEYYQIAMEYKNKWIEQRGTMFESDVDDFESEMIGKNDEPMSFELRCKIVIAIVCGMLASIFVVAWWIKTCVETQRQTHYNDGEIIPLLK